MTTNIKQQLHEIAEHLPDDCTIEDVQERLYVLQKIRLGVESLEKDGGISQEDVKKRLAKWILP